MADKESDEDVSVLRRGSSFHISSEDYQDLSEGISPVSSSDLLAMKGQSVIASKLFSPSRTRRNVQEKKPKSKSKGFLVHSSPVMKLTSAAQKQSSSKERRKTLQVLQPAASGDGSLVGSGGVIRHEKSKKKKSTAPPRPSKMTVHSTSDSTSTTSQAESSDSDVSKISTTSKKSDEVVIDEAVALMVSDSPSERYWELLAEERRIALKDALEENEQLHRELEELEELRERCKKLEEVAGQAEYFASLYKMVMEGQVETSDSSDTES